MILLSSRFGNPKPRRVRDKLLDEFGRSLQSRRVRPVNGLILNEPPQLFLKLARLLVHDPLRPVVISDQKTEFLLDFPNGQII